MTLTNVPSYDEQRVCCYNNQIVLRTDWVRLQLMYISDNVSNTVNVN